MPINRVSVFSLIHHLETQIWWVLNFKGIKVDPATLWKQVQKIAEPLIEVLWALKSEYGCLSEFPND